MIPSPFRLWAWSRIFRLLIGLTIIVFAIVEQEWLFVFFGVLFSLMPIFNFGCCGTTTCSTTACSTTRPVPPASSPKAE